MDKNYNTYDSIDFAQDPWFIKWVKSGDSNAEAFWQDWLAGHPDKKDVLEEARRLVLSIRVIEAEPSQIQIDGLWDKIDTATEEAPAKIRRLSFVRGLSYAAAAAVLLILGFWFLSNPGTSIQTSNAQQLAHILPDQSKIELNAASKILYKKNNWNRQRVVQLEGEAFFEVEKGSPFVVETPSGSVEVLGTSFNVFARDGALKVECFTGKVRVNSKSSDSQILTPGLSTQLSDNARLSQPKTVDLNNSAGWRSGEFIFDNVSFRQVLEEVERQFDVRIQLQDQSLLDRTGPYVFEKGDLNKALEKICYPLGLSFAINGKTVVLSKE